MFPVCMYVCATTFLRLPASACTCVLFLMYLGSLLCSYVYCIIVIHVFDDIRHVSASAELCPAPPGAQEFGSGGCSLWIGAERNFDRSLALSAGVNLFRSHLLLSPTMMLSYPPKLDPLMRAS